jgi:hypothetical protein
MFRSTTIIRELVLSLAKVILKKLGKIMSLCGSVAACLEWRVCCVPCTPPHNL